MTTLNDFHVGQRVFLSRVRHEAFWVQAGTIHRPVKSWDEACVRLDVGRLHDAAPSNFKPA